MAIVTTGVIEQTPPSVSCGRHSRQDQALLKAMLEDHYVRVSSDWDEPAYYRVKRREWSTGNGWVRYTLEEIDAPD